MAAIYYGPILVEIEDAIKAKKKQLKAASRANSYGVMSKVIKRHKKANPWLNRDVLNNYKRRLSRKKLSVLMPMVHLYHL